MNTKRFYSTLTILLVVFVFGLTWVIVLSEPLPIGADPYFHLHLAQFYVRGDFGGAWDLIFKTNDFFYPFFFQLIILGPVVLSGNPFLGLRVLELLFMPLTFVGVVGLVWRFVGVKAGFFCGLGLVACWSFMDGCFQARPESLDFLLFPLVLLFVLEVKRKGVGVLACVMVWSHGLAAVSSLFGVFVLKFREKVWRKSLVFVGLVVSPVLVLSLVFFGGALKSWGGGSALGDLQEMLFWTHPFPWVLFYCGLTLLGVPFLFRRNKSVLEILFVWSFVGNLVMLPFWADCWLQYSAIPWSGLFGIGVSRWHGWKLYAMFVFAVSVAALYGIIFWAYSFNHWWWQPRGKG